MNIELLIADMRAAVARGNGFNLSKRDAEFFLAEWDSRSATERPWATGDPQPLSTPAAGARAVAAVRAAFADTMWPTDPDKLGDHLARTAVAAVALHLRPPVPSNPDAVMWLAAQYRYAQSKLVDTRPASSLPGGEESVEDEPPPVDRRTYSEQMTDAARAMTDSMNVRRSSDER